MGKNLGGGGEEGRAVAEGEKKMMSVRKRAMDEFLMSEGVVLGLNA